MQPGVNCRESDKVLKSISEIDSLEQIDIEWTQYAQSFSNCFVKIDSTL